MKTIKYVDMIEGREYESIKLPNTYKKENGVLYKKLTNELTNEWQVSHDTMQYIAEEMRFKDLPWAPKKGDKYWYLDSDSQGGILQDTFDNHVWDVLRQKRLGIYRTKEEALEKARELGWIE